MKAFFVKHSYNMVKMLLNQIATAIFGISLAMASTTAQNDTLRNVTGVCSVLFYLFLLYTMTWEIGFRDRVSVESGKIRRNIWTGALISLCANAVNILFAVLILIGDLARLDSMKYVVRSIALMAEGMYMGLLANTVNGVQLNSFRFIYFLIVLPSILICFFAYVMGLNDKKCTKLFDPITPESDREPRKK